ncbi:hypothetical protein [Virgibacillus sp. LDC-1]|uniref:hypothetical protein n=1 Tax=Virgibacillus sp. LDC-1 TaxID=3039856 RepID=UPI0024DE2037|nr:hypothetical protein [Virgibacillus sp. LDC-1]
MEEKEKYLLDLTLEDMQSFSNLIEEDVFDVLQLERIIHARNIVGGTASCRVNDHMQIMKENMTKSKVWLGEKKATISTKRSVLLSNTNFV